MVILMNKKYGSGIDITFKGTNATVLVYMPRAYNSMPPSHTIKQMFGRGIRDHKTNMGYFYAVGDLNAEL